jgi:hypothetical protein
MLESFEKLCDRIALVAERSWLSFASVMLLLVWRLLPHSPADPDLFARLAMGRLVQTSGTVPLLDPFAFTEKLPQWIDHEWLSGVLFLWVVQNWGDAGLIAFKIIFATLSALFVLSASKILNPYSPGRTVWVALCFLHASYLWGSTLRCQAFTYLFLSYLLFASAHFQIRSCSRYLWAMPLISIPWINLHGGWALGMVSLGIFTATQALTRKSFVEPLLITTLCGMALFFTPYEPNVFSSFLFGALGMGRATISEWAPLINYPDQFLATLFFALVMLAGFLHRNAKRDLTALTLLSFSAYCGFRHTRLLGFFMLCAAVYGPSAVSTIVKTIAAATPERAITARRALTVVCTTLLALLPLDLVRTSLNRNPFSLDLSGYPTGAIKHLAASGESGRLLVDFNNGSFALWRLYPRFLISLDGRYEEVYPESTTREVSEALLYGTPTGKQYLEKIAPTHILTPSRYLHDRGLPSPDWSITFDDGAWALLRKGIPAQGTAHPSPSESSLWEPMF